MPSRQLTVTGATCCPVCTTTGCSRPGQSASVSARSCVICSVRRGRGPVTRPEAQVDRGYILTGRDVQRGGARPSRWPLDRVPLPLETSIPGVFAAGDARYRSVKRVASAVGDGATAVRLAHEYLAALPSSPAGPGAPARTRLSVR